MSKKSIVMKAEPFTRPALESMLKAEGFVFVQPKLKGIRLLWTGSELLTSSGNIVNGLPHITAALKEQFSKTALDGEAYCHGMSERTIAGICRRKSVNLHSDHLSVDFWAFDLPRTASSQTMRLDILAGLQAVKPIQFLRFNRASSFEEVKEILTQYLEAGFEGVVIRHPHGIWKPKRSKDLLKWKPKHFDAYTLVEIIEGTGTLKGTLGAIKVQGADDEEPFCVGSLAMSRDERAKCWADREALQASGIQCRIAYQDVVAGVPQNAVFRCFIG